jgi:hypothetical protein
MGRKTELMVHLEPCLAENLSGHKVANPQLNWLTNVAYGGTPPILKLGGINGVLRVVWISCFSSIWVLSPCIFSMID